MTRINLSTLVLQYVNMQRFNQRQAGQRKRCVASDAQVRQATQACQKRHVHQGNVFKFQM